MYIRLLSWGNARHFLERNFCFGHYFLFYGSSCLGILLILYSLFLLQLWCPQLSPKIAKIQSAITHSYDSVTLKRFRSFSHGRRHDRRRATLRTLCPRRGWEGRRCALHACIFQNPCTPLRVLLLLFQLWLCDGRLLRFKIKVISILLFFVGLPAHTVRTYRRCSVDNGVDVYHYKVAWL